MQYYVVTDIYASYEGLTGVLENAGFDKSNPEHSLISLGNLLDFGSAPRETLEYVMSVPADHRILIQGQHEVDMIKAINRGSFVDNDRNNGLPNTVKQFTGKDDEEGLLLFKDDPLIKEYLEVLQPYYETENGIFVSGWIPCYHFKHIYDDKYKYIFERRWRDATDEAWEDATRLNGMEAWDEAVYEFDKTIICGNYPAPWGHYNLHHEGGEFVATAGCNCPGCIALREDMAVVIDDKPKLDPIYAPFQDNGIINLNGCSLYGGVANAIIWRDEPLDNMPIRKPSAPAKKIKLK